MRQFDRIMAFLPCGNYNLHSPEGMAMNIHIRRQESPVHGVMHPFMQVAGNIGLPGPYGLHPPLPYGPPMRRFQHGLTPLEEPEATEDSNNPGFPEVVEVNEDTDDDFGDALDEVKAPSGLPESFWGDIFLPPAMEK